MNRLQQYISKGLWSHAGDKHTALELASDTYTIKRIVTLLESQGLAVYGPCVDLDTGMLIGANMDYDADQVLKYLNMKEKYSNFPFTEDEEC